MKKEVHLLACRYITVRKENEKDIRDKIGKGNRAYKRLKEIEQKINGPTLGEGTIADTREQAQI